MHSDRTHFELFQTQFRVLVRSRSGFLEKKNRFRTCSIAIDEQNTVLIAAREPLICLPHIQKEAHTSLLHDNFPFRLQSQTFQPAPSTTTPTPQPFRTVTIRPSLSLDLLSLLIQAISVYTLPTADQNSGSSMSRHCIPSTVNPYPRPAWRVNET